MSDPTNEQPKEWNRGDPTRRCIAHKKDGEQCRRWAIRGGVVCRYHGGSAPQVLAKARENLALAADHNRSIVQRLADSAESEQVRLQAGNSLMDRAGLSAKQAVDVELTVAPWQAMMEDATGVARITRDESRARRGLTAPEYEPFVDAEVVEEAPDSAPAGRTPAEAHDLLRDRPAFADETVGPPGNALMTMEEATAGQAKYVRSQRIHKRR